MTMRADAAVGRRTKAELRSVDEAHAVSRWLTRSWRLDSGDAEGTWEVSAFWPEERSHSGRALNSWFACDFDHEPGQKAFADSIDHTIRRDGTIPRTRPKKRECHVIRDIPGIRGAVA